MEHRSTKLFREYIQIPTVQPEPDYQPAVELLIREAESLGLATFTHECVPGKPVLIITWEGMDRNRKQIDINISAIIHTYIKLIIKRLSCPNCNAAALLLVLVPTCQHVRLFSAIQPESAVILNPSSVFVSSMFVTRRTR